ncbi:MAG: chemotaxis protein CheX [Chloroflexi bacterium]|nr:chemotaxis protein CheX [Chloroflexota bacterium]MDA1226723.1 chemotaxis protein CheX [Chloroflexota bacterium]
MGEIVKEEYINAFLAPAKLVWESELSQPLTLTGAWVASQSDVPEDVTAVVGVSGQLKGSVRYEFGKGSGLAVASSMMAERLLVHDEVSISALGEIANMITGNAAANLEKQGFTCDITPPSISIDGTGNETKFPGVQIIAAFDSDVGKLNIRIGLAESSMNGGPTEADDLPSMASALAKYQTRVTSVIGLSLPSKRRW